jgi:hypothetical protein
VSNLHDLCRKAAVASPNRRQLELYLIYTF